MNLARNVSQLMIPLMQPVPSCSFYARHQPSSGINLIFGEPGSLLLHTFLRENYVGMYIDHAYKPVASKHLYQLPDYQAYSLEENQ